MSREPGAEPPDPSLDETATNLSGPARLADGQLLAGRYRIVGALGIGAMGIVYRARDEELDLEVAVKVLRPELGGDERLVERFRRELVLARQVTHRHVVRIHDIGRDGDLVFLTMDLVPGRSLRQVLQEEGELPVERAVEVAAQLARALAAAHEGGVIHRDLKPSNVMIDAEGRALITDFGIARTAGAGGLTRTGFIVGTPHYLAPEQARGEDLDGRADLYALGVLLYELLTGRVPTSGRTADEALAQQLRGVPRRLSGLPPEVPANLRAILRRCLEPDRRRRYQSAVELADDLERLARPAWQPPSRSVLAGFAAGAAALALVVAGLVLWRPWRSTPAATEAPPTALAVLPFADETGRAELAWLATGVPELLFEALVQQPEIRVVNPRRVAQVVSDLKLEPGAFSESTLELASELFDSSRLLTGSIRSTAGAGIRIDARLVNPAAGSAGAVFLSAEAPPGAGAASRAVEALRAELLDSLELRSRGAEAPLTSPQLPRYSAAVDRLWSGEAAAARDLLEQVVAEDGDFGPGWLRLSQSYEALGRYEEALDAADRAVTALEGGGSGARFRLLARAQQARLAGEPQRAQEVLGELVAAYPGDVESAVELADAYGIEGNFPAALELLAGVVERAPANARAWFLRAKYSILSGQSRVAVDEYLVRAQVLQNRLRNRQGQADVMNAFGVAYRELGEIEQAEESYRRAAELRRELGDDRGYATSLRNLAQIAIFRGDFEAAEANLRAARETFDELGDDAGIADLYNEIGMMEEARSDYQAALANFRRALEIRQDLGDQRAIAESLNNIGFAHHQLGSYSDASVYWQRALDLYVETGNIEGQTMVRQSLGQLYTTRGEWQQAQASLVESLDGARQLDWGPAIAASAGYLGRVARVQGRYAAALDYYEDAVARFADLGDDRGRLEFSLAKGDALLELGAAGRVLELLDDIEGPLAAVGSVDQRAAALALRGRALAAAGDPAAGRRVLADALRTVADSTNQALRLRLRLEELRTAGGVERLAELVAEVRDLADKPLEMEAELALLAALTAAGRLAEAEEAAARLERQIRRLGDWEHAYRLHDLRAAVARARSQDPGRWQELAEREFERVSSGLSAELLASFRQHAGREETAHAA